MSGNSDDSRRIRLIYQKSRIGYYANALARRIIKHNISEPKFKKTVMSDDEGNKALAEMIKSGRPFAAVRFGGTEAKTIADVLYTKAGGKLGGLSDKTLYRIMNLSGFFPEDKNQLFRFTDLYTECAKDVDILGVWNIVMQSYLADEMTKEAKLSELRMFEPYYFDDPWTKTLKGKKVIIIHPFAETIESQYKRREQLFDNKDILPEFELWTVKAVQTLAGEKDSRFNTWFDALDYMYNEAMKRDFDIALIGCGAYGFPLATMIKKAGKQAVHIGGSLQLLFGIKGKRWDHHEYIGKLYNDSWVRPGEGDVLKKSDTVEGGCYW